MLRSDSIIELAKALAKAQGEFPCAKKDSENPFFNSKYADLASIVEAIQEPLAKHGLSLVQCVVDAPGGIGIETVLLHESGEWLSSTYSMPVAKHDAQGVGSAITYGKRYAMAAILRLATEDDDGNAATLAASPSAPKSAVPQVGQVPLAPNYGEFAKWPLSAVPVGGLNEYLAGVTRSIDNPEKAKYKQMNSKMREAILEELANRGEPTTPTDGPDRTPKGLPEAALNAGNICRQFRSCESIREWSELANAWQDESHLHSREDRSLVSNAADQAKQRLTES